MERREDLGKGRVALQGVLRAEKTRIYWWLFPIWILAWIRFFHLQPNPIGTYSAWGANYYLRTGQAQQFHAEYLERVESFRQGEGSDVVVKAYSVFPWFLGWQDLATNPEAEQNQFLASYYRLNSVRVRE